VCCDIYIYIYIYIYINLGFLSPRFLSPRFLSPRFLSPRLPATGLPATPTDGPLYPTTRCRNSSVDGPMYTRTNRHHGTFLDQGSSQFSIHPRTERIPATTKRIHHRTTTGFNNGREPLNVPLGGGGSARFDLFRNLALHRNQGCTGSFRTHSVPKWIHGFTVAAPSCVNEYDCSVWAAHILDRLSGGTDKVYRRLWDIRFLEHACIHYTFILF